MTTNSNSNDEKMLEVLYNKTVGNRSVLSSMQIINLVNGDVW